MINYQINNYLSVMGRIGLSENHGDYNRRTAFSTVGANNQYGSFYTKQNRRYELNMDFLLTFQKDLTESLNLKASEGGNKMRTEISWVDGTVDQLLKIIKK